jgi:hypothetical protein
LFVLLWIPAVILIATGIAANARSQAWAPWEALAAALRMVFVCAALFSLLVHHDAVAVQTAAGSETASNVVTIQEAVTALTFVLAAVAVASFAPSRR